MVKSISIPSSFPSFETAVRCLVTEGCRLVVATMSSARSYMIFTGLPDFQASSAAWPAIIDGYSSCRRSLRRFHLHDAHLVFRQIEQAPQGFVDVVRTLHRAPDGDA